MLQGLPLRRAILETLHDHQEKRPETPMPQEELSKALHVPLDRLEAHFVVLERSGYVHFLRMPGPQGQRLTFLEVSPEGEKYLANPKNFETTKGPEGPFKVVEPGEEKAIDELARLRAYVERTEWVLDDEKPEILAKLDELEKALAGETFDAAAVGGLKLWFERHRWLAPHVTAVLRKQLGF